MGYDPIWNSFTNSGAINDYLTYKRKKDELKKKVSATNQADLTSMK